MKRLCVFLVSVVFVGINFLQAQTVQVTGTVTSSEDGLPVPGASVLVKGTTIGISTDVDGRYSIGVPSNASTLVFRFIGYKTQEVEIGGRTVINVVLESDMLALEEIVVTAVGIQRSQKSLGYSVTQVESEKALQKAEPDALRALEGKIPGVQITSTSGSAGSATRITIRGNSSFLGNNQPLFVVDGIPYSNDQVTTSNQLTSSGGAYGTGFSTLDPNDIESMNVLKGAAAAALYGSRAANGAIIITTKSGSKKARQSQKGFEVTFASSYALETIGGLPEYQNSFGAGTNFTYAAANGSWGAPFDELDEIPTWAGYQEAYPDLFGSTVPYKAYPNNVKDLFDTGTILENSINVSSVSDKGVYNATISKLDQSGYIPYSSFDRYSFSAGGNQKLDNGLKVGGNVSYSKSTQIGPMFGNNQYSGAASSFARTLILARNWDMSTPFETPEGNSLMMVGSQADNPLWSWKYNTITTGMDRAVAGFNAGYDITSWLSVDYQIGVNNFKLDRQEVTNIGSRGAGGIGRILEDSYSTQEIESNLLVTITRMLTDDISLKGVLGHNVNQRNTTRLVVTGNEMISRGIYHLANTNSQEVNSASTSKRRLWGVFADVALGYKDYLFLNLTGRNDFSSTLPEENRSYFYPAVATSFVFSDAFNLKNSFFDLGRIRASWAKVGNDASPYYVNGFYSLGTPWSGSYPTMYVPSYSFDPELSPEFTTEIEFGTELQFFSNRIGVDFAWYKRNTTDQIAPISLPYSAGMGSYYTNFGELQNTGIELGLNLTPISMDNSLRWDIFVVYTKNKSEVISLTDNVERIQLSTGSASSPFPTLEPGQPYGILRGTVALRDSEGNYLINPNNGTLIEDPELKKIGDPNPDFRSSITNNFSFKGISLGIIFDLSVGGDIYAGTIESLMGRGVTMDTEDRYGTRIIPGYYGDPNTLQPILDGEGNKIPNQIQISENDLWFGNTFAINTMDEMNVYDATVYRLRELTIGYDIPKKWLDKVFVGSANISFVGRNLWYNAPNTPEHTNYDPAANLFGATNIQGIEYEVAPSVKRYGFNLRLTF
jgi:TonB-linked SusC/RagA family outer membrane protein